MKALIISALALAVIGCSNSNLNYVKERSPQRWKEIGFETVQYQGHQWGAGGLGTNYGGAKVWFEMRKIPDNGITYSGYLMRWGDELEVYGPFARENIVVANK